MKKSIALDEQDKKIILLVLAFQALGRSLTKHYKGLHQSRTKRVVKRKWKKILLIITKKHLIIEKGESKEQVSRSLEMLSLYASLYSDLVDGSAMEKCSNSIKKLKKADLVPSLKDELENEIDRLIAVKPKPKTEKKIVSIKKGSLVGPHLDPVVRERLIKHFKKELRKKEPLIMANQRLELRVNNFIRLHVDRIIDVHLSNGLKAVQYGFIDRTTQALSDYVEEKSKTSIDWTVESEIILTELVRGMG